MGFIFFECREEKKTPRNSRDPKQGYLVFQADMNQWCEPALGVPLSKILGCKGARRPRNHAQVTNQPSPVLTFFSEWGRKKTPGVQTSLFRSSPSLGCLFTVVLIGHSLGFVQPIVWGLSEI